MIYVLESGNYFKIGYAKDVAKRMQSYRTHNPNVNLIREFTGTQKEELYLHTKFKEHRCTGEWFNKYDGWLADVMAIRVAEKLSVFDIRPRLSRVAMDVAIYIIIRCGMDRSYNRPVRTAITLNHNKVKTLLKCSRLKFRLALNELIAADFITITNTKDKYDINMNYINQNILIGYDPR